MVISFSGSGQVSTVKAFDKLLYASHKDTLPYRLLKPAQQELKNKFPHVIFLHGAGERGTGNEGPGYSTTFEKRLECK